MATVFFDYDGTLHDTMAVYGQAFRVGYESLVRAGWAKPREFSDEWISRWLGWTIPDMWHAFMPNLPDEVWEPASRTIGEEMNRLMDRGCDRLFPGVPEMLDRLVARGYDLAILSNSVRSYMDRHRADFGLDRWFSAYYIVGDYPGMEKWEYFQVALGNGKHEGPFALVGDRFHDIDAAVRAGVPAVGCAYGFGDPGELDRASAIVQEPAEIPDALERLFEGESV